MRDLLPQLHRVSLRLRGRNGELNCLSQASLVAKRVKNPPAMQETGVQSLVWEDPLEKGMVTQSCSGLKNCLPYLLDASLMLRSQPAKVC